MSAKEQDPVRTLAERIASRLAKDDAPDNSAQPARRTADAASANVGDELAALRAGLSEIGQRLTQIESHVTTNNAPRTHARTGDTLSQQPSQIRSPQSDRATTPSPPQANANPQHWLSGTYVPAVHPSEERFGIDEAVSELVEFFEREKVCNVEPGGKPCDHCGMCSARGF
ncbi:MAG TPA: hypothetical protein VJ842_19130 [Pyrinomonadaceae bacterium]|nr:hypothetical protein [Pyrinomonadaceae bacterium]